MTLYTDPIIKKYLTLIEDNNSEIKGFFQGDPFKIPASKLPAVFISKVVTEARPHNNAEDEHGVGLRVTVVVDIRKELSDSKEIVAGISQLYDILEGRGSDYKLKSSSILGMFRNNIELDLGNNLRTDLGTITRVDYGDTINRRELEWFIESYIDITAFFTQVR